MLPHPTAIRTVLHLHHQELLATAARQHRAATVAAPTPRWRPLAVRILGLIALSLGLPAQPS